MERRDSQNSGQYVRNPTFTKYKHATRASGVEGRTRVAAFGADEVVAEVQSQYGVSTKMAAVALEMLPAVHREWQCNGEPPGRVVACVGDS